MRSLEVEGVEYTVVDTKEKMTVADSFVKRPNKIMLGNGEAKFYLGNDNEDTLSFFGERGFEDECFMLKRDLLTYLTEAKPEYMNPEQMYRGRKIMRNLWKERWEMVSNLPEILWFSLRDQTQIEGPRVYAKSNDQAFDLIRELSLPFITYLSAIKLKGPKGETAYYFRPFLDYFGQPHLPQYERTEEKRIEDANIPTTIRLQLQEARIGQGKFRNKVLKECPTCPVTLVTDDRILIASHIKPWAKSNDREKLDPKNGFMFTPTYDFLFDRGFISFQDDKDMLVSPWLSKMTCSKLSLKTGKRCPSLPSEGREVYLDYHRANIFKA